MNCFELLEERVSIPVLEAPAPTPEAMQHAMKAALRAPDHGQMRPWRFLLVTDHRLKALGELFADATQRKNPQASDEELARCRQMPMRAPMLVVAIARISENPKVPEVEQQISAGTAVLNLMLALRAQGYGAMWRTGALAYDGFVKQGLGLADHEQIVGFIYVGTPAGKIKPVPDLDPADYFKAW